MANLSKLRRQKMLDFLAELKEKNAADDHALIALNEIESELTAKKYGLVWEQHEERVDVEMRTNIPVFTEDKSREIKSDVHRGGVTFSLKETISTACAC